MAGLDIDAEGYFEYPAYGRLLLPHLAAEGHAAGEAVPARVLRDGSVRASRTLAAAVPGGPAPRPGAPKRPGAAVPGGKHRIEVTGADDLEIDSYPGALSQIVTNFLMNSLIHAYEPDAEGVIRFDIRRENDSAVLTYSDNGRGIPSDSLGRIFEPFFTTRRGRGGSGLGMHIVYNLVTTKLNGVINCASEVDEGTTFTVTFPINAGGKE